MQHIFDLKYSGLLDLKTQGVMREARCGVPDVENFNLYPGWPKWKRNTITYRSGREDPQIDGFYSVAIQIYISIPLINGLYFKFVLVFK